MQKHEITMSEKEWKKIKKGAKQRKTKFKRTPDLIEENNRILGKYSFEDIDQAWSDWRSRLPGFIFPQQKQPFK